MKIDAKKYIKFFEYIILIIIFLGSFWLYIKMFFSSALMCFILCVYTIISMMIIGFISSAFHLAMDSLVRKQCMSSTDAIATALDYHSEIMAKIGYILFVGGTGVIYLLQLIIQLII